MWKSEVLCLVLLVAATTTPVDSRAAAAFFLRNMENNNHKASPNVVKPSLPQSNAGVAVRRIRIRSTIESDIPVVAKILSTASTSNKSSRGGLGFWQQHMDQLMAKVDIESLLMVRLQALQEGQKVARRLEKDMPLLTNQERLQVLWATSDKLRSKIAKASRETGEANLWQSHNFSSIPHDASWLNHLQMTTEDVSMGRVVGFCEVGMLSNPLADTTTTTKDRYSSLPLLPFSPAITNLATAPEWQRQGIAKRMLRLSERFCRQKWKASHLGLYVEKNNPAAIALYHSMGYQTMVTCDGGDHPGELWYMVKSLSTSSTTCDKDDDDYDDYETKEKEKDKVLNRSFRETALAAREEAVVLKRQDDSRLRVDRLG